MLILYLSPNDESWDAWMDRIANFGDEIVVVRDIEAACLPSHQSGLALAICRWNDQLGTLEESVVARLRSRYEAVYALVERTDQGAIQSAYRMGVDDCIFADCSKDEWKSKLKQVERTYQLRQQLTQSQKLVSIGELAAGVAHEINTPIQFVGDNTRFVQTSCQDLIEVLDACQQVVDAAEQPANLKSAALGLKECLEEVDSDFLVEEIPAAITQTLEGVDRVTRIVRAMKEFVHPGTAEMTPTNLRQTIENTLMVAQNEWKYVADVVTDFDEQLPDVPCLPGELNQSLLNMIVNASHAIAEALGDDPEKKGEIKITTNLATPFAEIRIADTGCGISEENISQIFSPFFTTKAVGKGTGHGLAIAHNIIVEKHLGTISVKSRQGVGTTFVIRIPLELETAEVHDDAFASS